MTATQIKENFSTQFLEHNSQNNLPPTAGFIDQDGVYQLSAYQLEKLRRADEQLANGKFITGEEMDRKVAAWLKEE